MKKKLIVLGMAGALLFSGLSVSAAVNECGHPSVTEYGGTELRNGRACSNSTHTGCTLYDQYKIEVVVCHYCYKEISRVETLLGDYHTFTASN